MTALYEKYKADGFTVVGVNGYDEPKDLVEKFMSDEKLTHPVVLLGGKVASEQYHVRGYPTSYWVDHEGNIVDREVGFGQGSEKKLASMIEQLLAARNGKSPADKPAKSPAKDDSNKSKEGESTGKKSESK